MRTYTANDICRHINCLRRDCVYGYVNPTTHGEIQLVDVCNPYGPIHIRRRHIGGIWGKVETISAQMLWRIANALNSGLPINVDRVLGGSYNTRSVLEALLAYTPEIFTCTPGRQEMIGGQVTVKRGHKHIIWKPDSPHEIGVIETLDLGENCVINEVPSVETMYDVIPVAPKEGIDIDVQRRHSQIQVALSVIASSMNMRSWLAIEDHGIKFNGKLITEYPYIVKDLKTENVIANYPKAISVGKHIDCMYFNGGLPFAFEVEHTTGVTSGLTRMQEFRNAAEYLNTRYVVVAPDSDREDVMTKIAKEQFEDLDALYFPYSQVEELYSFFTRHPGRVQGIKKDFLLTFMEKAG